MLRIIPIKELTNAVKASDKCNKNDAPICISTDGYGNMVNMSIEVSEQQILEGQIRDARASLKKTRKKYGL